MTQLQELIRRRRALGIKPRRAKPAVTRYPISIEREYAKALRGYLKPFFAAIKAIIMPNIAELLTTATALKPRVDDYADDIEKLIEAVMLSFNEHKAAEAEIIATYGTKISSYNASQLNRTAKAALGVDVFLSEPYLTPMLNSFIKQNSSLIGDITATELKNIEGVLQRGVTSGKTYTQMAREIQERTSIATNKANLIARDQTATLNGLLSKTRMENLGVTRAIWRTAGDSRVRDSHAERDGMIYTVSEGLNGLFPGEDYNCRCVAEPVIEDLLEDE